MDKDVFQHQHNLACKKFQKTLLVLSILFQRLTQKKIDQKKLNYFLVGPKVSGNIITMKLLAKNCIK